MQTNNPTRRTFLAKTAMAGVATAILPQLKLQAIEQNTNEQQKKDHLVFLFQGDSITDGNRGRSNDPNHIMGHGYAFSIASRVGAAFPEKALTFYNRGISGNKVQDLHARWQNDTINLKPDVLSILVGVNDVDYALKRNDTSAAKAFEEGYRSLLDETKKQLPDCLIIMCEPFIAPVGRVKEFWNDWQNEIQKMQAVTRQLAKEYNAPFIPLQEVFDNATRRASADYWIWDGIHPTVAGHELITQAWLKQVGKRLPFLKNFC